VIRNKISYREQESEVGKGKNGGGLNVIYVETVPERKE